MNQSTQHRRQSQADVQPRQEYRPADEGAAYAPGSASDQAVAIAQLPPDLAILKMDNESIMSLAAARPRNQAAMKDELLDQLTAYPKQAAGLIYNKPVGRDNDFCTECGEEIWRRKGAKKPVDTCPVCRSEGTVQEGAMKFARGLSVRAAEMLSEVYGFNRVRTSTIINRADGSAKLEATFVDFQRGRIWQDDTTVSMYYTGRDGSTRQHPEDRFMNIICKSEKSKLVREVINRSVSAGMKAWLTEEAERIIDTLLDDAAIAKILGAFSGKGVKQEQIEALLGRTLKQGWTQEQRRTLQGLWNAIEDGETTIVETFGEPEKPETPPGGKPPASNGSGVVTGADLASAKVKEPEGAATSTTATTETPAAETSKPKGKGAKADSKTSSFDTLLKMINSATKSATLLTLRNDQIPRCNCTDDEKCQLDNAIEERLAALEVEGAQDSPGLFNQGTAGGEEPQ